MACLCEGLIHEWKHTTAPHTANFHHSCVQQYSTNDKWRILVKAQHHTKAPGHSYCQLGLAFGRETWAYPTKTVLATVTILLLLDTNLLSQAGIYYSQLHYTTTLTG